MIVPKYGLKVKVRIDAPSSIESFCCKVATIMYDCYNDINPSSLWLRFDDVSLNHGGNGRDNNDNHIQVAGPVFKAEWLDLYNASYYNKADD